MAITVFWRQPKPWQLGVVKALIWFVALIPFARLVLGVVNNSLGPNPIETITRTTGWYTLVLLCVTLSVTPLRRWTALNWLVKLRRVLGLFAFFYAALHFTTWLWFDHFFAVGELFKDIVKRPFIAVGFAGFLLLIPLAITSTNSMVRRLGGKRWQALHRLIYVIAPLGALHFWWAKAGKNDLANPLIFALLVAALLGVRVVWAYAKRRGGKQPA